MLYGCVAPAEVSVFQLTSQRVSRVNTNSQGMSHIEHGARMHHKKRSPFAPCTAKEVFKEFQMHLCNAKFEVSSSNLIRIPANDTAQSGQP
eukprot:1157935-Pelagomonas_calceolata.AAC.18